MSVKTASRADSRTRLLEAATAIVGRAGAANLTIDGVAAEAGLSKGGVLYHFPSKRALLEGMLEKLLAETEARADRLRAKGQTSLEAWINSERTQSDAQRATSLALLANAAEDPSLLEAAQPTIRRRFEEITGEAKDPDLALILLLATEGLRFLGMLRLLPLSARQRTALEARLQQLAGTI